MSEPANAYLTARPEVRGSIRTIPDDFVVEEVLGFQPAFEGEHLLLQVRKRSLTTRDVVTRLSSICQVRARDIGYCGMKDRNAVTTQWFSVPTTNTKLDIGPIRSDRLEVLYSARHRRKLRRGTHRGNRFKITIRDIEGSKDLTEARLKEIYCHGVPNYFGEQRFGRSGANMARARKRLVEERQSRFRSFDDKLLLSSARAFLFNRAASHRISAGFWSVILPGDIVMLDGSRSVFVVEESCTKMLGRLRQGDIHLTGPLWGTPGSPLLSPQSLDREREWLSEETALCDALGQLDVSMSRRALRVLPASLRWQWISEHDLCLEFELPRGSYATSVLREILNYTSGE